MLMLVVWIVTALLVLVVLGSVLFGVLAALRRLGRELAALDRELEPVRTQARASADRATALRSGPANRS